MLSFSESRLLLIAHVTDLIQNWTFALKKETDLWGNEETRVMTHILIEKKRTCMCINMTGGHIVGATDY